ncbi:MAG: ArsR/SmtB family transcription factor [Anaerolineae bacterium]
MTELLEQASIGDIAVTPEELAPFFKALAHPKRLAILQVLRDGEHCVCEIEAALDLRQAYVSQQLTVLREAGLVCYRKDGWNVYYRIARPEVYTLLEIATLIHGGLGVCATTAPTAAEASSCCGQPSTEENGPRSS